MTLRTRDIARMREELVAAFPAAFAPKGQAKKPLKVGIFKDIIARRPYKPWHLGKVLDDYTRGPTYLQAVIEGAERVDLDGNVVGTVTASQAQHAQQKLQAIVQDMQRRRKQREAAVATAG